MAFSQLLFFALAQKSLAWYISQSFFGGLATRLFIRVCATAFWQKSRQFNNGTKVSHGFAWFLSLFAWALASAFAYASSMIHDNNTSLNTSLLLPITMGKYRIAACPRPLGSGRFEAQVSIASGHGSMTTDRVIRFIDNFSTHDAAAHYALAQGIDWVCETTHTPQ